MPRLRPNQHRAYDDIEASKTYARILIKRCETALGHALTNGECRDLLADNTRWSLAAIADIVRALRGDT